MVFLEGFAVWSGRRYRLLYLGLFVDLDLDNNDVVAVGYFVVVVSSCLGGCVVEKQVQGHMQDGFVEGAKYRCCDSSIVSKGVELSSSEVW